MEFAVTSRLKDAVALMNATPAKKFPLLLGRIVAKLSVAGSAFTDAEQEKLAKVMALTGAELSTVLEAVAYIFEKAVYEGAKPSKLQNALAGVGLSTSCVGAFTAVWTEHRVAAKEAAAAQTIAGPRVLTGFTWRTNMHLAKSSTAKLKEQSAIFDFTTKSADKSSSDSGSNGSDPTDGEGGAAAGAAGAAGAADEEQFAVEMSHAELYEFFLKLERIQAQLDGLGK